VVVISVEEGDVEAGEGKKLGQLEHGVDVSLSREGKNENMGRRRRIWALFHTSDLSDV
jgi:hypothetical protein